MSQQKQPVVSVLFTRHLSTFEVSRAHRPPRLCGQRGGFSCLTQSWFDTSTSGQQPPFGSRMTHTLPNRNNLGIMAPPRPSKEQIRRDAGIRPCCFLRSACSSQEEWEKGTHREQRPGNVQGKEVKPESTRRPLKDQKLISALQRTGPANKKRLEPLPLISFLRTRNHPRH